MRHSFLERAQELRAYRRNFTFIFRDDDSELVRTLSPLTSPRSFVQPQAQPFMNVAQPSPEWSEPVLRPATPQKRFVQAVLRVPPQQPQGQYAQTPAAQPQVARSQPPQPQMMAAPVVPEYADDLMTQMVQEQVAEPFMAIPQDAQVAYEPELWTGPVTTAEEANRLMDLSVGSWTDDSLSAPALGRPARDIAPLPPHDEASINSSTGQVNFRDLMNMAGQTRSVPPVEPENRPQVSANLQSPPIPTPTAQPNAAQPSTYSSSSPAQMQNDAVLAAQSAVTPPQPNPIQTPAAPQIPVAQPSVAQAIPEQPAASALAEPGQATPTVAPTLPDNLPPLPEGVVPPAPLLDPPPIGFVAPADDPELRRRLQSQLPSQPNAQIVLPRRPRPVVPQAPVAEPLYPEFVPTERTPEQALSILDRLNRQIETEDSGESVGRPMLYEEILNWQANQANQTAGTTQETPMSVPETGVAGAEPPAQPVVTEARQVAARVNPPTSPAPELANPNNLNQPAAQVPEARLDAARSAATNGNSAPTAAQPNQAGAIPQQTAARLPEAQAQAEPAAQAEYLQTSPQLEASTYFADKSVQPDLQIESPRASVPAAALDRTEAQPQAAAPALPENLPPLPEGVVPPAPLLEPPPIGFVAPADDPELRRRLQSQLPSQPNAQIVLPRRPRPVVPQAPVAEPLYPEFVPTERTPEQALSILDRLNRQIETEDSGESVGRPMLYEEILNWQANQANQTASPEPQPQTIEAEAVETPAQPLVTEARQVAAKVNPPASATPPSDAGARQSQPQRGGASLAGEQAASDARPPVSGEARPSAESQTVESVTAESKVIPEALGEALPNAAQLTAGDQQPQAGQNPVVEDSVEETATQGNDKASLTDEPATEPPSRLAPQESAELGVPIEAVLNELASQGNPESGEITPLAAENAVEVFEVSPSVAANEVLRAATSPTVPSETADQFNQAFTGAAETVNGVEPMAQQGHQVAAPKSSESLSGQSTQIEEKASTTDLSAQTPLASQNKQVLSERGAQRADAPAEAPIQSPHRAAETERAVQSRGNQVADLATNEPQLGRGAAASTAKPSEQPEQASLPTADPLAEPRLAVTAEQSAVAASLPQTEQFFEQTSGESGLLEVTSEGPGGIATARRDTPEPSAGVSLPSTAQAAQVQAAPTPAGPAEAQSQPVSAGITLNETVSPASNDAKPAALLADAKMSSEPTNFGNSQLANPPTLAAEAAPISVASNEAASLSKDLGGEGSVAENKTLPSTDLSSTAQSALSAATSTSSLDQSAKDSAPRERSNPPVNTGERTRFVAAAQNNRAEEPVAGNPQVFGEATRATAPQTATNAARAAESSRSTAGQQGTQRVNAQLSAPNQGPQLNQSKAAESGPAPLKNEGQALARSIQKALANTQTHEPLPMQVQSKLHPLLGRSTDHVRIIRDAHAAEATAAAAADALAVGDAVLISPGQDLTTPQGIGLLAHEMTHVLRDRDPSFVPAVAKPSGNAASSGQSAPSVQHMDEETLAERVERRAREIVSNEQQAQQTGQATTSKLPAPWEPMPYWEAPVAPRATDQASQAGASAALQQVNTQLPSMPPPAAGSRNMGVRAASASRSTGNENGGTAAPNSGKAGDPGRAVGSDRHKAQKPIDLDLLAHQVYNQLKKRLALEIRRDR